MDKRTLFIIVIVSIVVFALYQAFIPKWTLGICGELMPQKERCATHAMLFRNKFRNKEECLDYGRLIIEDGEVYPGFMCMESCKEDSGSLVCKQLCNAKGYCW